MLNFLLITAESVEWPLLAVLLKDKQHEDDHVAIEVVEVASAIHSVGRVIDATPEHVEDHVLENLH